MNRTTVSAALLLLGHVVGLVLVAAGVYVAGALVVLATHGFFMLGTLPNSQLFGPVMRSFATRDKHVWLTFDDGVDAATTPQLLDCLAESGAKATFFVIGERAERAPELIDRMRAEGHDVGDHTRTHPHATFWAALPWQLRREISADNPLFRAPVGMCNWFVHALLRRSGRAPVGWSARGLDGVATPRERVVARLSDGIKPGAILALHDGYDVRARGYAPVDIVRELLGVLDSRGYRAVLPHASSLRAGPPRAARQRDEA